MKHHWIWILLILFISGCGQGYDWGWYVVSPLHPQGQTNIQFLISGLWYTLLLSVMAILPVSYTHLTLPTIYSV